MVIQYAKFVKMGKETKWRSDIASLNYIEVSLRYMYLSSSRHEIY